MMEIVRNEGEEAPSADSPETQSMIYAQQKLEQYMKERPLPDNLPLETRKKLMEDFKKQCSDYWLAGYLVGYGEGYQDLKHKK